MTHLGLFAGIGGFEVAARWAGWETVAWCELEKFCQTVLKFHFPNADQHSNIRTADFTRYAGEIDVLTGGFPCQPYSTAGKRLGKEDERHLWPEMLRAIREVSPRWVVGENVRGLTNWNGGVVFDEVQIDLESEGYEVLPFLLPAAGVDAPHVRDRIWFVAHATSLHDRGDAGKVSKTNGRPIREMFSEFGGTGEVFTAYSSGASEGREKRNCEKGPALREKESARVFIRDERDCCDGIPNWRGFPTQPPICSRNDGIPGGLVGITVPSRYGRRTLTPRQAMARLRRESIKAYGNAIVPQVALQIFNAINQYERRTKNATA